MNRWYIKNHDFEKALKWATIYACEFANQNHISRIVYVAASVGLQKGIEDLLINHPIQIVHGALHFKGCNSQLVIKSIRNYCPESNDFAIYCDLSSEEIMIIEEQRGIECAIAIQQSQSIDLWGGTWGVKAINYDGESQSSDYVLLTPNGKIQGALRQMTSVINMGNTIAFNTTDEDFIKFIIRTLHKYEKFPINTFEMQAYAIRECRWKFKLASIMIGWMEQLNDGHSFKGGKRPVGKMKSMYQEW